MKNLIKVERSKLNITQEQLALEIEVSRQTIYSIERGRFTPSIITAFKIARYFKVQVEDIFMLEPTD